MIPRVLGDALRPRLSMNYNGYLIHLHDGGKSRINKPTSTMKATQTTNKEFFLRTANAIIILALTTCFVFQVSDQVKFCFLKRISLTKLSL